MRIRLLAVGRRVPVWVSAGYADYARRLPHACRLELVEIAPGPRRGGDRERALAAEDERIRAALGRDEQVIALHIDGKAWTTEALATAMRAWLADGRDRALLIGGADGLGPISLARAHRHWSLSAATLPHALVRVIVAEQLYRAHSILAGQPYHRG